MRATLPTFSSPNSGPHIDSTMDGCVGVPKARENVQLEILELAMVDGPPLIKVRVVCPFHIRAVPGI